MSQRPIGNHLKISKCQFRIVNRSFIPRMEMLRAEKEIEKYNYVSRDCQDH